MGISRLLVVAALAVVGFVAAVQVLDDIPFSECQAQAPEDNSYQVAMEPAREPFIVYGVDVAQRTPGSDRPTPDATAYELKVTQNGEPVTGADVCLRADRGGAGKMSGLATSAVAEEKGPGEYDVNIRFEMAGHWNVHALIRRPGQAPVDVPFAIQAQ